MDSMNGQHGNGGTRDSQAAVLSVLLSILASKRVVLDRQHAVSYTHLDVYKRQAGDKAERRRFAMLHRS